MDVLVTISLPEHLLARIKVEHSVTCHGGDSPIPRRELESLIDGFDGILCTITDRIDASLLEKATRLKVVANYGVGYDNIDVRACSAKGVLVTNTPDVLTDATADLTMALVLSVARRVAEGDSIVREGKFRAWSPFGFLGTEVSGKTLGIIGLGRIGKAVAERANGFKMKVLYYKQSRLNSEEERAFKVSYAGMQELLKESDFVSLHVPLTQGTYHLMGAEQFSLMKRTSYLINTSRGPVVDEEALVHALETGVIAGAGLDVYEKEPHVHSELIRMKNVVLLPHLGSATIETRTKMAERAVSNLLAALRNERPMDCLNWEAVYGVSG
ncbi:MAG: D-glycerate dehydrogenase [Deltaproteobacteria bacterium]|nr:MAG: D-glycerate dehydrogenase [Deltaproteobacteria bacterium]